MTILGIFLIVAGIAFIAIGLGARKFAEATKDDWKKGFGRISGYNVKNYSSYVTPLVRLDVDGESVLATASSIRSSAAPEPGETVEIEYRRNDLSNGRKTYNVIVLLDGKKPNEDWVPYVFLGIGILLGIGGIVATIAGFLGVG